MFAGQITNAGLGGLLVGRLNVGIPQVGAVTPLGDVTRVTVSMGDGGGRVSNIAEFIPAPGTLGNASFACRPIAPAPAKSEGLRMLHQRRAPAVPIRARMA